VFICRECRRVDLDFSRDVPGPLLKTTYQQDKHRKHTLVSSSEALQSIFSDPSTSAIRAHVENAVLRGPVEVDVKGRVNFYSTGIDGQPTGHRYEFGTCISPADYTRVVLSTSPERWHAFPDNVLANPVCDRCGRKVFS
jgi:hypothetical protein